jgi:hypothetical protein
MFFKRLGEASWPDRLQSGSNEYGEIIDPAAPGLNSGRKGQGIARREFSCMTPDQ